MQHVEAGLVGREPGALHTHAAEGAHGDPTVRRAAPGAAPVLELDELPRSRLYEGLDRVLIREEVTALQRVVGVELEAVVRPHRARGTALGGHRVAAHGVELRDHRDGEFRSALCHRDRRAQTGRSPADQYDIVALYLHRESCRQLDRRPVTASAFYPILDSSVQGSRLRHHGLVANVCAAAATGTAEREAAAGEDAQALAPDTSPILR